MKYLNNLWSITKWNIIFNNAGISSASKVVLVAPRHDKDKQRQWQVSTIEHRSPKINPAFRIIQKNLPNIVFAVKLEIPTILNNKKPALKLGPARSTQTFINSKSNNR